MSLAHWAAGFCAALVGCQVLTVAVAAFRLRRYSPDEQPGAEPAVSILLPVCGIDNFAEETLKSGFYLDYPDYELIFCAARTNDPAVTLVQNLIEAHPEVRAQLLIGEAGISSNPKLNNISKGWNAARYEWVIVADSNVLMRPDYVRRLLARWRDDSGAVCSMPIGTRPHNFWAELECAFLNTLQARYQYVSESFGFGFAQGKTMLFQRDLVERAGGIRALAAEGAEDAAATKMVRERGLRIHLVDKPVEQPLGWRSAAEVWSRQLRWARLRRVTFRWLFLPEIFVGSALPVCAAILATWGSALTVAAGVAIVVAGLIASELALARNAGWHRSWRMPIALLLRDLLLPLLWVGALVGSNFVWRGKRMTAVKARSGQRSPSKPLDRSAPELSGT